MLLENIMVSVQFTKSCPFCWPSQGSYEVRPKRGGGPLGAPTKNVPGE